MEIKKLCAPQKVSTNTCLKSLSLINTQTFHVKTKFNSQESLFIATEAQWTCKAVRSAANVRPPSDKAQYTLLTSGWLVFWLMVLCWWPTASNITKSRNPKEPGSPIKLATTVYWLQTGWDRGLCLGCGEREER